MNNLWYNLEREKERDMDCCDDCGCSDYSHFSHEFDEIAE